MSHPVLTVHGMDTPLTSVAPQDQQHRLQDAIDHLAGPLAAHAGEGTASRQAFEALSLSEQDALLIFLETL